MPKTQTHSPGPWEIEGKFDADVSVTIVDADGNEVVELYPLTEEWTDTEIANARLIAAAPQLLQGLKRSVEHFGDPLKLSRTAIAKAEGRDA